MPSGRDWDLGLPLNLKEARRLTSGLHAGEVEHKYDYAAVLAETPAYGWQGCRSGVGLWLINPSQEYIGGGPTKVELTGHLDCNPGGLPVLLNMWKGSHYGGTSLTVAPEEWWVKVVGPFFLYCNRFSETNPPVSGATAQAALWQQALAQAATEAAAWPYAWVQETNYPLAASRGGLQGQLVLHEPWAPEQRLSNVWVGLAAPDYPSGAGRNGFPSGVDWQRDARFYQFWSRAAADGHFQLSQVRPGRYTLHAIADGVLGELSLSNLTVAAGAVQDLGCVAWKPVHFGRPLWQIGVPNRSAREFRHGQDYWHWGLYLDYSREFPQDVHFRVGQSDWQRDWNYVQPPRGARSTTWTVEFVQPRTEPGRAMLRLAFCGAHAGCQVEARLNGQALGDTGPLPSTSTMQRDGIQGYWVEKDLGFDASLLQRGTNTLELISRAHAWNQGVLYDCLRLEVQSSGAEAARGWGP